MLRGCGPRGYPGMPEVGNMPLPEKLLRRELRDMVRISDARMGGTTSARPCYTSRRRRRPPVHSLVRTGNLITLDVRGRDLTLHVDDDELASRGARDSPLRRSPLEDGRACTSTTYSRPIAGATSTSWSERRAP